MRYSIFPRLSAYYTKNITLSYLSKYYLRFICDILYFQDLVQDNKTILRMNFAALITDYQ